MANKAKLIKKNTEAYKKARAGKKNAPAGTVNVNIRVVVRTFQQERRAINPRAAFAALFTPRRAQ